MSDLSNKTNGKDYLLSTFNDNQEIKRFTKKKRKNENSINNRKCCLCQKEIDDVIKKKDDLINHINNKNKQIINKNDFKLMKFKENIIICKSCLDKILESEDYKRKKKKYSFLIEKEEK